MPENLLEVAADGRAQRDGIRRVRIRPYVGLDRRHHGAGRDGWAAPDDALDRSGASSHGNAPGRDRKAALLDGTEEIIMKINTIQVARFCRSLICLGIAVRAG
ncbi:hypothetical protein IFR09_12155 [Pseudomonas syringae]|nr:hypothetical protein [Pseudomonas syringae]MBD8577115.1 hypothetical protein [Pseudomonas syringae]MBD8792812.1 hypothetical protein [Pseudomonas syringae]MBD8803315.1 hypothetical protein [Pseudomonas syringae]MBD8811912.1 hypothetical protein [Pseudomonas syringae]